MRRRRFLAAAGGVAGLGTAGCVEAPAGGPGDGTGTATTTAAGANETPGNGTAGTAGNATAGGDGGPAQVRMVTEDGEYYFDPIGLFVEPGATVEWVIESGAHSATAYAASLDAAEVTRIPEGAEPWNSTTLTGRGASFRHTLDVTGTYDYFCVPHKTLGMVGRLVVGEPGGVEGDPPDGSVPAPETIVERGAVAYDEFTG